MDRQRRLSGSTDRLTRVFRGAKGMMGDVGSRELARLGKLIGNDEALAMVARAEAQRDALLEFIRERLRTMMMVQQLEKKAMTERPDWARKVGLGAPGFKLPDPSRWKQPAELYRKAAEALCSGQLGRAAEVMDKAVEAERIAFESLPQQVELNSQLQKPENTPDERAFVEEGAGCNQTTAPDVFATADRIIAGANSMGPVGTPWVQKPHAWWEVDEVEDPEKKKAKKGAEGEAKAPERAPSLGPTAEERTAKEAGKEAEKSPDQQVAQDLGLKQDQQKGPGVDEAEPDRKVARPLASRWWGKKRKE